MNSAISLSDSFNYPKLIRFVLPSVLMMVFTSLYTIVDGLFISNFVGKTPFAAVNLIMPLLTAISAFGFMIGTGGSALVAKTLGEGKREQANRYFSLLVYFTVLLAIVLTTVALIWVRQVAIAFGAEGELLEQSLIYGRIMISFQTASMLMNVFQSFFVAAEKPKMGLYTMLAAGVINIALDALFIIVFEWGVAGAAIATVISQVVGAVIPLVYFARPNSSLLRLTKTVFDGKALLKTCANGSSELMANISISFVNMLYNYQLMKLAGEDGVAAFGVMMYANFIFMAIFFGYSIGSAPLISYQYGAQNHQELKNLFKKSFILVAATGVVLTALAELLCVPLADLFVGYDRQLFDITCHGFRIYALAFILMGINIFASAFFTALNNGLISAAIAFSRTVIFETAAILLLPALLGIDGVWSAVIVAEIMAMVVSTTFFLTMKKRYHYL